MTIVDQILAAVAGRQTVRRAELFDTIVLLQPGEVQTLLRFAGRMLRVED